MQTIEHRPSEASKKTHERSEFRVAFDLAFAFPKNHENTNPKIVPKNRVKRDSIEFERSENIGQFCLFWAFNYFKCF